MERFSINKTYKLYIDGAFSRSESDRSYKIQEANIAWGSRKDLRDAVYAARKAFEGWSGRTAYNRGQILYRIAEIMEGRTDQFIALGATDDEVAQSIDTWVWYAGWSDKIAQVLGSTNPVSGPYFNFTIPEPSGVIGVLAPESPPLLGLTERIAPALVSGNTIVGVASESAPFTAITLAEVFATSDIPSGVINLLTGRKKELSPWLASHMDINAIDLYGAPAEAKPELQSLAAENIKRISNKGPGRSLWHIAEFLELKTFWHPIGL